MKKRNTLIGAALICATLTAINHAQPGVAQSDGGFAGKYNGTTDGGKASATIRQASPGNYTIDHSLFGSADGCSGAARGAATARGNVLELRIPIMEAQQTCVITYRKNGNRLAVSENSCGYLHGLNCSFNGALVRKAGSVSQQTAPQRRIRTAEPLFGLTEEGGPAGGDLVRPTASRKVSAFSAEWYPIEDFVAVDDGRLGLTMSAVCDGTPLKPMLAISPSALIRGLNIPDYDAFAKREETRLFSRTPTLTLSVFDGKGGKSATLTFGRVMREGSPAFYRPLSAREEVILKTSSRMSLSSAAWTTSFTGKGAAKMFAALGC